MTAGAAVPVSLERARELLAIRFYSPEEVTELLGGHISADTIRSLVKAKEIAAHRGPKGRVLFDLGDIQGLKDYYRPRAVADPEPEDEAVFNTTSRSAARARSKELKVA